MGHARLFLMTQSSDESIGGNDSNNKLKLLIMSNTVLPKNGT